MLEENHKMKITDVKTVLLTGPCTNDPFLSKCRKRRSAAFIEIHTDTELVGIGETYAGYHFPEVVPQIVEFFKPILIGQDVSNISELWRRMYQCGNFWCRVGVGLVVLNGIEAALWDLKGKMYNLPVYELLGGHKHDKLLCYATGGPSNYPKDELAKKIDHYLSLGFKAFKLGAASSPPPVRLSTISLPGFPPARKLKKPRGVRNIAPRCNQSRSLRLACSRFTLTPYLIISLSSPWSSIALQNLALRVWIITSTGSW